MDGVIQESDAALFERDPHAWLVRQARLLHEQRLAELDIKNLAELLDQMARRERREVSSRLTQLLMHLLKFECQPDRASRSWLNSVQTQQNELQDIFESPSLRQVATVKFDQAFSRARQKAAIETGLPLDRFPVQSPWTLDDALGWRVERPEELPGKSPREKRTR